MARVSNDSIDGKKTLKEIIKRKYRPAYKVPSERQRATERDDIIASGYILL